MNLLWHIVWNDARRLWAPLALWILVIMGHRYVEWMLAHLATEDAARLERMKFLSLLFFSIEVLNGYVLTAMLLMEDPPTGTSTFWLTRPISGGRMLGAKIAGCIAFFIALPLLVSLPWLAAGAADAEAFRAAVGKFAQGQAWLVAFAMAIAAFTGSFGKFVAWTLGLIPVAGLVLSRWGATSEKISRLVSYPPFVFMLVGVAVAVFVQYKIRRRAMTMKVLGAFGVGAIAMAFSGIG